MTASYINPRLISTPALSPTPSTLPPLPQSRSIVPIPNTLFSRSTTTPYHYTTLQYTKLNYNTLHSTSQLCVSWGWRKMESPPWSPVGCPVSLITSHPLPSYHPSPPLAFLPSSVTRIIPLTPALTSYICRIYHTTRLLCL